MLHKIIFILGCAAVLCGLYLLMLAVLAVVCRRELRKTAAWKEKDGELSVYAEADSLEYAIRCALLASGGGKIAVTVNIRHDDRARDEMIDMTEKLSKTHKNLRYRIV